MDGLEKKAGCVITVCVFKMLIAKFDVGAESLLQLEQEANCWLSQK